MRKLKRFHSKIEAELALQNLDAAGIKSEVHGAKEYASFIVGSDVGVYELSVSESDFAAAEKQLHQLSAKPPEPLATSKKTHFKKAVMFSFVAAIILPIIFNYASLVHLNKYRKLESNSKRKLIITFIVLLLQIPGIVWLYLIGNSIFHA